MAGILAIKRARPERDPTREALALAINELTGFARALELARRNVDRAKDLRDQAAERFDAAVVAAGASRGTFADAMLHSAKTGEAISMSSTSRELRHAETDAADALEAARAALTILEEARDEAAGNVSARASISARWRVALWRGLCRNFTSGRMHWWRSLRSSRERSGSWAGRQTTPTPQACRIGSRAGPRLSPRTCRSSPTTVTPTSESFP